VIAPLYAAYAALCRARGGAQPLDLDLPERRIELAEDGRVTSVAFRDRLDAHRLIEEFMVLANVAAAEDLGQAQPAALPRARGTAAREDRGPARSRRGRRASRWPRGRCCRPRQLNRLLDQAAGDRRPR
jgi:ribonuclease R